MAEQPISATEHDVKDQGLLLRLVRKIIDRIASVGIRVARLEAAPPPPTVAEVRDEIEALGQFPLRVDNLRGQLADPQPASATVFPTTPAGLVLQGLRDQQLIMTGNTSTGFTLSMVRGGNPNTLYTLVSGLSTGNFMTLDTAQTSTGDKILTGRWQFNESVGIMTTAQYRLQVSDTGTGRGIQVSQSGVSGNTFGVVSQVFGTSTLNTALYAQADSAVTNYGVWIATPTSTNTNNFALYAPASAPSLISGNLGVGASSTGEKLSVTGTVKISSRIVSYNGEATVGSGVPYIVARAGVANTSASSTAAFSYTPPVAGEYRISYYILVASTGSNFATVSVNYSNGFTSITETSVGLNYTVAGDAISYDKYIHASTSGAISLQVNTGTSTVAPNGTYSVYTSLEKLTT